MKTLENMFEARIDDMTLGSRQNSRVKSVRYKKSRINDTSIICQESEPITLLR